MSHNSSRDLVFADKSAILVGMSQDQDSNRIHGEAMASNLVGRQLGKYQIQAEIGRGGMGIVYQAHDPLLDRKVAIKVLAPHLVWEAGFVERFLREARAAARLKHTGIVTVFDVGQEGSWYYIVMEYLEGRTLAQIIHQQGRLPSDETLSILHQLAEALNYAHQSKLIHRDIKPGNIVIDSVGLATLTDFGVARAAQETKLTTTGALIGTPQYMSPEQARGEEVDHRTDIYALGVVAYEMLTGRAPFDATTPHAVLHQLIYEPTPSLQRWRPEIEAEVDRIVARAMAKEPASRYATAPGFVDALEKALMGQTPARGNQLQPGIENPSQPMALQAPGAMTSPVAAHPGMKGWIFWLQWSLVSALGWAVGWALGAPIGDLISRPVGAAMGVPIAEVLGGAATWTVIGIVMGAAQWMVLRRQMESVWGWILATAIGLASMGSVKWSQGLIIDGLFSETLGQVEAVGWGAVFPLVGIGIGLLFEGLTGLAVGTAQWLVLRQRVRKADCWIPISVLGWAFGLLVIATVGLILGEPGERTMFWVVSTIGGITPGAITGAGLVWLLSKDRQDRTLLA
jgi:hypothetical protein